MLLVECTRRWSGLLWLYHRIRPLHRTGWLARPKGSRWRHTSGHSERPRQLRRLGYYPNSRPQNVFRIAVSTAFGRAPRNAANRASSWPKILPTARFHYGMRPDAGTIDDNLTWRSLVVIAVAPTWRDSGDRRNWHKSNRYKTSLIQMYKMVLYISRNYRLGQLREQFHSHHSSFDETAEQRGNRIVFPHP